MYVSTTQKNYLCALFDAGNTFNSMHFDECKQLCTRRPRRHPNCSAAGPGGIREHMELRHIIRLHNTVTMFH